MRRVAKVGDWVIGTGSSERQRKGYLVYVMRITETMTFNEYWSDSRFQRKKPNVYGSTKNGYGDNIYFKDDAREWHQSDSHHSYEDGTANQFNIANDTQTDRVLISADYAYWGGAGPEIPDIFRDWNGHDICALRNHKSEFPEDMVNAFIAWVRSLGLNGYLDRPLEWRTTS
jgi:hypothetical protein